MPRSPESGTRVVECTARQSPSVNACVHEYLKVQCTSKAMGGAPFDLPVGVPSTHPTLVLNSAVVPPETAQVKKSKVEAAAKVKILMMQTGKPKGAAGQGPEAQAKARIRALQQPEAEKSPELQAKDRIKALRGEQ